MESDKIPVVWGVDKKYVLQVFVVIHSILMHSTQKFHFFILTEDEIEYEVEEFIYVLKKKYFNFEISVIRLKDSCLTDAKVYNGHLSKAAYYRIFIPDIVLEYAKCIYLDCDVIVYGDLSELYRIELGNDYLAGVKDCHIIEDTLQNQEHRRILNMESFDKYINSGVMVMNLKKMREDQLVKRFKVQLKRENRFEDQDVLNYCCYPAIQTLALKYNLFHFYFGEHIRFLDHLPYERDDLEADCMQPFILHMGGRYKPWNDCGVIGGQEWWRMAGLFCESKSYKYYKKICWNIDECYGACDIISMANKMKYVVVWGYSENGKGLCNLLLSHKLDNIIAIADNQTAYWGTNYRGIPVRNPIDIVDEYKEVFWVISSKKFFPEIESQLKDAGIDSTKIWLYENFFEDRMYLLSLDQIAYGREIVKMADREYSGQFEDREAGILHMKAVLQKPLEYEEEYTYLSEKYHFEFWLGEKKGKDMLDENNDYHSLFE